MSDIEIGPYGVHINQGSNVNVTANQLVGAPAGSTIADAIVPGVGPAMHSTAPYLTDAQRRPTKCIARAQGTGDRCEAYRKKGSEYCIFHQPDDAA